MTALPSPSSIYERGHNSLPFGHATLTSSVTEKHTTTVVRPKQFWVGLSDMQGWRISEWISAIGADDAIGMEDSHSVHLYLPPGGGTNEPSEDIPEQPAGSTVSNEGGEDKGVAMAAVFDGHGGSTVAKFSGTTLHTRLASLDSYSEPSFSRGPR